MSIPYTASYIPRMLRLYTVRSVRMTYNVRHTHTTTCTVRLTVRRTPYVSILWNTLCIFKLLLILITRQYCQIKHYLTYSVYRTTFHSIRHIAHDVNRTTYVVRYLSFSYPLHIRTQYNVRFIY